MGKRILIKIKTEYHFIWRSIFETASSFYLSDQIYFSNSKYPDPGLTGLVTSHTRPAPAAQGGFGSQINLGGKISNYNTIYTV